MQQGVITLFIYFVSSCLGQEDAPLSEIGESAKRHLGEDVYPDYYDYYEEDGDFENEPALSMVPFCCQRHHYYDPDRNTCLKSVHKLDPKFYSVVSIMESDKKI